jgi:hypothetical protein
LALTAPFGPKDAKSEVKEEELYHLNGGMTFGYFAPP